MKKFLTSLWQVLRLPEMLILPGNLAFFLVLSLAPLVSLFGLISSSLSLPMSSVINYINEILPSEVVEILIGFIDGSGLNVTNIMLVIIGFMVASNGPDSLIIASNFLYKTENKNYIYRKIKSIFITFWMLILFVIILVVLAFGSFILNKLSTFDVIGNFIVNNYTIIILIKTLIAFVIIFITIKIIYTMAPDKKIKSKYVNYGALFATIAIIVISTIYSAYVNNIAHYDIIYGSLANIIILMLLVYFISYVIILGIAINSNYYKIDSHNK